jgi:signal peptidase I
MPIKRRKQKEKKANAPSTWRRELKSIVIMGLIIFGARSSLADWYHVPTGSMKPTIVEGDRVFVNKLAYDLKVPFTTVRISQWSDPQPGEIIVFKSPVDRKRLVKRVIAGPGDTVAMVNNVLIVNGTPCRYDVVPADELPHLSAADRESCEFYEEQGEKPAHLLMIDPDKPATTSFAPLTVPPNTWFFLGDNRHNSLDSRFIGTAKRDSILGRAQAVIWSVDKQRKRPRKRFLKELL